MSVWIRNLGMALRSHPVLVLHGNVRDRYIDEDGRVHESLTSLLRDLACRSDGAFDVFVRYDLAGKERRTSLTSEAPPAAPAQAAGDLAGTASAGSSRQEEDAHVHLARWANELRDSSRRRFYVLFYLDKVVPYRDSYEARQLLALLWLEKALENIAPSNRLVLVALQDTMVPVEVYTHSPQCRVLQIPRPDQADRERYLRHRLRDHPHLDLVANLTDGLYVRELDGITGELSQRPELGSREVRHLVNRFRIGEQEDYWGRLSIERLDGAFRWFTQEEGVKGQDHAIRKVVEVLCRARAGLSGIASGAGAKPKGVLFFAGPPGVGKTLLAKKLAKFLFSTEDAFIRLDMSECKEEHSLSKLIGSPPGYVGSERGGMLTNAVRERPFSVVLFDEIEKAHPSVLDVFLQVLDEGRLTDSRGQTVFFTETVIVFTSNIGNRAHEREALQAILESRDLGDGDRNEAIRRHFLAAVRGYFETEISRPELLRRIGNNIVPFYPIRDADVQREIVLSHLGRIKEEFEDRYRPSAFRLDVGDARVADYLVSKYGAEEMSRHGGGGITNAIEDEVITALARALLRAEHEQRERVTFRTCVEDGALRVRAEN